MNEVGGGGVGGGSSSSVRGVLFLCGDQCVYSVL